MNVNALLDCMDTGLIAQDSVVTQLKREENDELYQVWRIDSGDTSYILKEAGAQEAETYQSILAELNESSVPTLYQTVDADGKIYLLMEYIDGDNLCHCNRPKLAAALDALISLQQKTWDSRALAEYGYSYEKSLSDRQTRGKYLNDPLLEEVYEAFLAVYQTVPRALCHDDLLPFNVIASEHRAVLIDWEYGGILPYPTSFARLIAHGEDKENAFFYMTQADRNFAIDYYYDRLLKEKGISYTDWRNTLAYFLLYEYCEWVFVGNKYGDTDGEYYQKYLPMARQQAEQIKRFLLAP